MTPEHIKEKIRQEAYKERIYQPKYGGKDHSGYNTIMLYEVNDERDECFEKGANYGYSLAQDEIKELVEAAEGLYTGHLFTANFASKEEESKYNDALRKVKQLINKHKQP
jgi:hypothetical protein